MEEILKSEIHEPDWDCGFERVKNKQQFIEYLKSNDSHFCYLGSISYKKGKK